MYKDNLQNNIAHTKNLTELEADRIKKQFHLYYNDFEY